MPAERKISVLHLSAADSMLFPILRDQLKYLRERGYDIHTASIDGPLAHRLRHEDGFPWTPLPLTREISPLADLRARRFIEELCRRQRFDIVHTHTPKGNLVGQWAARRAGVPIVLQTLHGLYVHEGMSYLKRRFWLGVERFATRFSDHVLCQNPEDLDTLVRERIAPRERITLLGNGIDLQAFQPAEVNSGQRAAKRQELGIAADDFVVGMVGRFTIEKGFPEFLAAGRALLPRIPKLRLLAIGHQLGSERAGDVWRAPEDSGLGGRLTVLANRDDMPALYGCMDVHVLPSHREGFPRALMEGAAAGLAQVCTNIRGCRQAVEEGRTGLMVPVQDVAALAAAIGQLADNAALRAQFGAAARAKAVREFDQQAVFKKVEACYQGLLREKLPERTRAAAPRVE